MDLTEHFALSEFASSSAPGRRDILPPEGEIRQNVRELAEQLEVLRSELDDKQISIISGYRSPEHNARVRGAKNSQHLAGRAADIRVAGLSPKQVAVTIEYLIANGQMKQGGIGVYSTFVHYDTRGVAARWGG